MKRTLLFLFSLLTLVYANALTWTGNPYGADGNPVDKGTVFTAGSEVTKVRVTVEGWGSLFATWNNLVDLKMEGMSVYAAADLSKAYLKCGDNTYPAISQDKMTTQTPAYVPLNFESVTAAGTYSLVIEDGFMTMKDGSSCAGVIEDFFTIEGGGGSVVDPEPVGNPLDKYKVDPAEGEVESLKTVKINFTGLDTSKNEYITINSDFKADVLINGESKNVSVGTSTYTDLNINLGITEAGEYTVVIPAGVVAYELDYVADWTKTNPEITLHYTVEGAVSTPLTVVSIDPVDNATLTAGETLETIVTFPVYLAGLNYGIVTLKNEAGESFEVNCNTSGNGNNLLKITSKEALVAGNYTLTIPAGVVCDWSGTEADQSKVNPEIVLHYTVEGGETPVDYFEGYTSTFSEGVKIVSVVFPNAGDNVVYFAEGKSEADIVAIAEDGTQTPSNRANGAAKTFNFQFSDVTADGTYTFEIPAGTLVIDDISNEKAITGSFTIEPKSTETYFDGAVFDPADGASVATLKVIKVTYSNVANGFGNIQYTTVKDKITLIGNGQTVNPIDVVAENSYPYQTIYITFDEVTDAGEYTLNIEKGTFNEFVSWGETPTNFNEAVSAKFTVTGGVKVETFGDAVWTPAEGAQVESLEVVTVNFPNLNGLLSEFSSAGDITLTCEGKELPWYGTEIVGKGATIRFAPNAENAITTPGEYTLTVPAGYFYDSTTAEDCPELTLHFTVVAPKASTLAEYTVDPEDGYTFKEGTEMNVAIKFTKVEYISAIDLTGVTLVDEKGASMDVTAKTSGKYGNVLEIKATGLKNSKYTLTVPAGTVCDFDGPTPDKSNANEEIVLHYTLDSLDGVSAIFGDSDSFTVVTVDGVVVLKDADADALNQLPAGLYIVNGKKLVIRK